MDRTDRGFIALLLVALAAVVLLAVGRLQIEARNRVVEIIVDAGDVHRLSAASGMPVSEVLPELRAAGASALGVQEATLEELFQSGQVIPVPLQAGPGLGTASREAAAALGRVLQRKFPHAGVSVEGSIVHLGRLSQNQLWEAPLLLPPGDITAARSAGLRVVPRLGNFPASTDAAVEAAAAQAEQAGAAGTGATLVVFRGDQVLGYRGLLRQTARAFARHHLLYGFVEIAEQKGEEGLAPRLASRLVRVHSISDADLETISAPTAISRYARAVRERGIRACYVRLLPGPQAAPLQENLAYVSAVASGLREEGFRAGPPAPLTAPADWPSQPARWLVAIGVAAGLGLLLRRLLPVGGGVRWGVVIVTGGLLIAMAVKAETFFAPAAGLLAASVFPALGLALALQHAQRPMALPTLRATLVRALAALGLASLCSLLGGLLVVGLYAKLPYLQGIRLFTGVKLAYVVPLLTAFFVGVSQVSGRSETMPEWWGEVRPRVQSFFRSPVSWGGAIAIVIALAAVALALMRSGNESAVAPSGLELKMRTVLEALLVARPRTKEFLLGHPALMLAAALAFTGRRTWLPLIVLIAAFGQISLLNTFCHFHVPLTLSLVRSLHGVWIGALFGLALVLVWRALTPRPDPAAA